MFRYMSSALCCYALLICHGLSSSVSSTHEKDVIPKTSDNTHATPEVVEFIYSYYNAKSSHNITAYLKYFHPTNASYTDVTLGSAFPNRTAIEAGFTPIFAAMEPGSLAYPLQIVGDMRSVLVHSVDTPGLFGPEIRLLTIFDFLDGKLTRVLDVWDGRRNVLVQNRGRDVYYNNLGLDLVHNPADPRIAEIVNKLSTNLASGNVGAVESLFSSDAILQDFTLRTRIEGSLAIGRYLGRSVSNLPYGVNSKLRHVGGFSAGGGYEWKSNTAKGVYGVSVIELDRENKVTRYTTSWDGSRVNDGQIRALTDAALEN